MNELLREEAISFNKLIAEMKVEQKISVAMVSDQNFIIPIKVAIYSMRKSTSSQTFIKITILCSQKLDMESRKDFKELEEHLQNIEIGFYEIDDNLFNNARTTGEVSITSYYRLLIAQAIDEDKCIFIDGDMLITVDLNEIFSIDISDQYIAGVKDLIFTLDPNKAENHREKNALKSMDTYINAGLIVFNLKKIREDNIQKKFFDELPNKYVYMDQDIINNVCYKKIKLLPLKYNVFAGVSFAKIKLCKELKRDEIDEAAQEKRILHYVGPYKPWNNIRINGAKLWWELAEQVIEKDLREKKYAVANQLTLESDWAYILKKCEEEQLIIIIGYSEKGIDVYESLRISDINAKFLFCDNSKEKQMSSYNDIIVLSVEEAANNYPNALWLNTSQLGHYQIEQQLIELGICKERIIFYKYKSDNYYATLSEEYIEYEKFQLELKNKGKNKVREINEYYNKIAQS